MTSSVVSNYTSKLGTSKASERHLWPTHLALATFKTLAKLSIGHLMSYSPCMCNLGSLSCFHGLEEAPVVHQPVPGHLVDGGQPDHWPFHALLSLHAKFGVSLSSSGPGRGTCGPPTCPRSTSTDQKNSFARTFSHMPSTIPPSFSPIRPTISESIRVKPREFSSLPKARFARLG